MGSVPAPVGKGAMEEAAQYPECHLNEARVTAKKKRKKRKKEKRKKKKKEKKREK